MRIERHGMHNERLYHVWQGILRRCCNPHDKAYPRYGGRGITICNNWRHSFLSFFRDMGEPPSVIHQIDRINNDGNYEPNNCRWVLPIENLRNRSFVRLTTEDVKQIWKLYRAGMRIKGIASLFNVDLRRISDILHGRKWKDLRAASVADVVEAAR